MNASFKFILLISLLLTGCVNTNTNKNFSELQLSSLSDHRLFTYAEYNFRKGAWSLNDYDYQTPTKSLHQTVSSKSKYSNIKQYEHYEYTPYHDFGGLKELTVKRIEAEEVQVDTIEAASDCSSFYAGGKFNLSSHAVKQEQGVYITTAILEH